jgi:outer membrane protein assembly factor BamE (lipoprotein component of BamABCDE complex)
MKLENIVKRLVRTSLVLALSLLITGCQTSPKKLAASAKGEIHESMTRDEVHKILGKPDLMLRSFEEERLDRYVAQEKDYRYLPADSGYTGSTVVDSLSIRYDSNQKVEKILHSRGYVVWNSHAYGDTAGGTIAHTLDTRTIKRGESTLAQLKNWFGEPTSTCLSFDNELMCEWIFVKSGALTGIKYELLRTYFETDGKLDYLIILEDWNWDY